MRAERRSASGRCLSLLHISRRLLAHHARQRRACLLPALLGGLLFPVHQLHGHSVGHQHPVAAVARARRTLARTSAQVPPLVLSACLRMRWQVAHRLRSRHQRHRQRLWQSSALVRPRRQCECGKLQPQTVRLRHRQQPHHHLSSTSELHRHQGGGCRHPTVRPDSSVRRHRHGLECPTGAAPAQHLHCSPGRCLHRPHHLGTLACMLPTLLIGRLQFVHATVPPRC
mmetsp:Transcript_91732/g.168297  ORF Transcript_91732/g.168297 Transcript_91732/m.168297 type:complete len:227 (-) Transcript_91732:605-1285(-)